MTKWQIYVSEPDDINLEVVKKTLNNNLFELVLGNPDFSANTPSDCNVLLMRTATNFDESVLTHLPNLKHVVRVGTGLDNVDLDFCARQGISVYHSPGANADAVAEYATTVILMVLRKLNLLERSDITKWNRFKFMGQGVKNKTIGIVGFGNIGRDLHKKLTGLGCDHFLVYDPFIKEVPNNARLVRLQELTENSDIITLHLPLTEQTKYIINDSNLATFKDGVILLNASRGGIVDEKAVLKHGASKNLTYIADTVEDEPHVNPDLINAPFVMITPHIGSLTNDAVEAMVSDAVQNMLDGRTAKVL